MKKSIVIMLFCLPGVPAWSGQDEYQNLLDQARFAAFNEEFTIAQEKALAARRIKLQDPESYEITTFNTIFVLKRAIGVSGTDPVSDKRKLQEHQGAIERFDQEIFEGLRLAHEQLRGDPANPRTLFLVGKLDLNRLMLVLQILNKKTGRREYLEARKIMDDILIINPDHCGALVASGWMNYIIGSRWFYERVGLALLGISGDKQQGVDEVVRAANYSAGCSATDKAEARFSLLEVLKKEKQWRRMHALAKELSREFPKNSQLKKHLAFAEARM